MAHVAFTRGDDPRKTARKAVDDLGHDFWKLLKAADYLFVYVRVAPPSYEEGGRGEVETLRGVLDVLRLYAEVPIVIGDAPERGAMKSFVEAGLDVLTNEYRDIHLLDLTKDEIVEEDFVRLDGGGLHIRRAKTAVQAPFRLTLGSVADWSLGTWIVPPRDTPYGKSWSKEPFVEALPPEDRERLLSALFLSHPCHVSVRDGILSGQGVLASLDPVAADTVVATMSGLDAHGIPHLEEIASQGNWSNEIAETDIPLGTLSELMYG